MAGRAGRPRRAYHRRREGPRRGNGARDGGRQRARRSRLATSTRRGARRSRRSSRLAAPRPCSITLDTTREADWEAAIPAVIDRFGGLDILVNNAGRRRRRAGRRDYGGKLAEDHVGQPRRRLPRHQARHGRDARGRLDHQHLLDHGLYGHGRSSPRIARARGRSDSSPRGRRWTAPRTSAVSG